MSQAGIKEEYIKQVKLSKINLDGIDPRTKFTQEGIVNAAKQKVIQLKPIVMESVLKESTVITVEDGIDMTEALAEITEKNQNISVIDAMALEKAVLASAFKPNIVKGFPFNSSTVSMLNNAILDIRSFVGASFIPPLTISANKYKVFSDRNEAMAYLSQLMNESYGTELKSLYVDTQISNFISDKMEDFDKMVFFIVNAKDGLFKISNPVGKFVTITKDDGVPATATELQKLVSSKLKKK